MKKVIILLSALSLAILTATTAHAGGNYGQPTQGRDRFLGINGTVGVAVPYYQNPDYYVSGARPEIKLGVDCAYPVGDRFSLGLYASIGGGPVFSQRVSKLDKEVYKNGNVPGFDLKLGLLALVGNINENPYILGVAPCTGFGMCNPTIYLPVEVRFGRLLGQRLYVTGNLAVGVPLGYNDGSESYLFIEPTLSVGFNFGPRQKKARNQ